MLLQSAYAVMVRAEQKRNGPPQPITEQDSYISYLPAAHSFEQAIMAMQFITGLQGGFYGGETTQIVEDIGVLAPTIFPSVPRLYNRIYGRIQTKISQSPGCLKSLLNSAVNTKLANLKAGKGLHHGCYDDPLQKDESLTR